MKNPRKKYKLTPEHEAQLPAWRDLWIKRIMSTEAMTDEDRDICRAAVKQLYICCGCKPPPDNRIIFVPSPFVLAFAAGAAAWIRYAATAAAANTDDATYAATEAATRAATAAATRATTRDATYAATYAATADATYAATAATYNTFEVGDSYNKWYLPGLSAKACYALAGKEGLCCATLWNRMWQGGNQWGSYDSYLSFFRHIAKLDFDYTAWDAWETLSIHSGPRIIHKDFCMISDRPSKLMVDNDNEPHCEDGPFCQWRDGTALYAIHGVRVPAWIVEFPEAITVEKINQEGNTEVRRIMLERYGFGRYFMDAKSALIDFDASPVTEGGAPRMLVKDAHGDKWLVGTDGGTKRVYTMSVPREAQTCKEAHIMISGLDESRIIAEA